MILLISVAVFTAFFLWYALWGRDWLKTKSWMQGFFNWIEPLERVLFKKSGTILKARIQMVTGVLLTFLAQAGTIDFTPLMPFVPEKYQWLVTAAINSTPLVITLLGMIDEKLRNDTTLPIEQVALPPKVAPEVAAAVAATHAAVTEVKIAISEAKANPVPEPVKVATPPEPAPPPPQGG